MTETGILQLPPKKDVFSYSFPKGESEQLQSRRNLYFMNDGIFILCNCQQTHVGYDFPNQY